MDMHRLLTVLATTPDLVSGSEPDYILPEPWSSLVRVTLGVLLFLGRRRITNVFAAMMRWMHLPAGHLYHRLGHITFGAIGVLCILTGVIVAATSL